jgi:CubicO group peptidase (beta-lactamase class C family)
LTDSDKDDPRMNPIDRLLKAATDAARSGTGGVAGLVALATDASGPIYQGAFGTRVLGEDAPMALDSVFWIASMTKALTAAACMQLVERGALDLDAPIGGIVPALAAPRILEGFDAAGAPILRPARTAITLRQLLTHTAGFAYGMWNADMARFGEISPVSMDESFTSAEACLPLVFEPGTGWAYGVGIDWAGKALESVTGQTLDAYFREHLFSPLGMHETGFLLPPNLRARLAGMHKREPDGSLSSVPFLPPRNPANFRGGGGLFSTGPDYLRFVRMMLNGGTLDGARVLRPETVELMARNHIGDLTVQPMRTAMPAVTNDAIFYPGHDKKLGLSFLINTHDAPDARRGGSLAWAGLFNTYYWIDPASGVGGLILTQTRPFADATVLELYERFEMAIYATEKTTRTETSKHL